MKKQCMHERMKSECENRHGKEAGVRRSLGKFLLLLERVGSVRPK